MNLTEDTYTGYIRSWADRNGFSDWAVALIWLIVAFLLFQVAAGAVFIVLLIALNGLESSADVMGMMTENLDLLFIGNSTGQILFLGLATLLIVKLHISGESRFDFIRLRWEGNTLLYVGLAAVITIVVQPVVMYLGYLNSLLPVPDFFTEMQASQYEMFEQFLRQDGVVWFGLFHIAMVPAFCEEILFRGYILKAFEKSWGIVTAILVSGLIFGLYHVQLTNLLPLATLGILFAVVTWLSGSIWPAIVAHFVNNGSMVLLATINPEMAFTDISAETLPPFWMLLLSILFTAAIGYQMVIKSPSTQKV